MSVVEIAPIVKSIEVRRGADEAFRMFTAEMSAWWPLKSHSRAKSAEGEVAVSATVEPRVGGRVYETLNDGREIEWGVVEAHEPGALFVMSWRMARPESQATRISVRFEPIAPDRCRVTVTHDKWERLGEEGARLRGNYDKGWVEVFEHCYGGYAGA